MRPDLNVFISCTAEDIPLAERLCKSFENYGIEGYVSGEKSDLHTDLQIEVRQALMNSYAVFVIGTLKSLGSPYVQEEIEIANENGLPLVLLNFAGHIGDFSKFGTIPYSSNVNWVTEIRSTSTARLLEQAARHAYDIRPSVWKAATEPAVTFSSDVTPQQVNGVLTALSKYWRSCGGIGLVVESHGEEVQVEETVHA